jgi:hypothetical protein
MRWGNEWDIRKGSVDGGHAMGARWARVPGELQWRAHRAGWAWQTIVCQTMALNVISTIATAVPERVGEVHAAGVRGQPWWSEISWSWRPGASPD